MALLWATQMEELSAERYKIHLFDIDKIQRLKEFLREKDNCEVFIKGIVAASSVYIRSSDDNQPLCLRFKNLPDHFFDILLDVSIPISLMDFSRDLQLCFTGKLPTETRTTQCKEVVLLGNCVGHATQNAYIMSLEHGVAAVDTSHYVRASEMLFPYGDVLAPSKQQYVCPFSVIATNVEHDIPDYFKNLTAIAKRPIVDSNLENRGYRFEEIHMRLGNKVHVTSFYELSFLFYRTSVANSVAFYIIQNIKEDLARAKGTIVFYGYASYSQALVFSLKEMLSAYFEAEGIKKDVHCAIYQYNLQTESDYSESVDKPQDKTQVYTTLPKGERITSVV